MVIVDASREELSRLVTPEVWRSVGKSTIAGLQSDLYGPFSTLIIRTKHYLGCHHCPPLLLSVLDEMDKEVKELASGHSATRWLWYLGRLPMFVFEGMLSTTGGYDASLAETASGTYGTVAWLPSRLTWIPSPRD